VLQSSITLLSSSTSPSSSLRLSIASRTLFQSASPAHLRHRRRVGARFLLFFFYRGSGHVHTFVPYLALSLSIAHILSRARHTLYISTATSCGPIANLSIIYCAIFPIHNDACTLLHPSPHSHPLSVSSLYCKYSALVIIAFGFECLYLLHHRHQCLHHKLMCLFPGHFVVFSVYIVNAPLSDDLVVVTVLVAVVVVVL
jgi:hypothetical protein